MPAIGVGPALSHRRERSAAAFDFSAGTLPPGVAVARASAGACVDATGRLTWCPPDTPRFDHDPASRRLRGLLVEGAATNLVLYSHAPGEAAWTTNNLLPPVAATVPAPDGTMTAQTIGDASTATFASIAQGVSAAEGLVASAYIAKDAVSAGVRYPVLRLSPPLADIRLDTQSGAATGHGTTFGVIDAGTYWRVWRAALPGATSVTIFPAAGSGEMNGSYASGQTGSITLWGVQVEVGAEPGSLVPSGASPGQRAADRVMLDWASRGVGDGPLAVRCRHDDGSHQMMTMTVAGGVAVLPTTLARRHVMRIERV